MSHADQDVGAGASADSGPTENASPPGFVRPQPTETRRHRESLQDRDRRLIWTSLGLGLVTIGVFSLGPFSPQTREDAHFLVYCGWAVLSTGLLWLRARQQRTVGVVHRKEDWFDVSQPLQPEMLRIPLKSRTSDWLGMLLRAGSLLPVVQIGLVALLSDAPGARIWLLPWLALVLWLAGGFARILWQRVSEMLVLTQERLIWHLGPCQVQIPYAQLEEVVRGLRVVTPGLPRCELVLVTRGMMTVVARPGFPPGLLSWVLFWLLPRRELMDRSGPIRESFLLSPANELLVLEEIAERAPHLVAWGTGLLMGRPEGGPEASPDGMAHDPRQGVLATHSERRVLLDGSPFGRPIGNVFTGLLLAWLMRFALAHTGQGHQAPPVLRDWLNAWFIMAFMVWFAFLRLWRHLWQRGLQQCPLNDWPQPSAGDRSFRLVPSRSNWLGFGGQFLRLAVFGLSLLLVGRGAAERPDLSMFLGLGIGIGLTLVNSLLRQIWVALRGGLWLLEDRVLCDRGWTRAAMAYGNLQEVTWTSYSGAPEEGGELQLRSAAPVQIPALRGWWSVPWRPTRAGREIPTYWQDRVWLITLAEPERFLQEIGPHVPNLVRIKNGWIIPLPSTEITDRTAGKSANQTAAHSTTDLTARHGPNSFDK